MEESQLDKLGDRMREVYPDVAGKRPRAKPAASRRRRENRNADAGASLPDAGEWRTVFAQHPVPSLLIAAGVGYVLGRL